MHFFVLSLDEIRKVIQHSKKLGGNQYVYSDNDVTISYRVQEDLHTIHILSEQFGNTKIDFSNPSDRVMAAEYVILAQIHGYSHVILGDGQRERVNYMVNHPTGKYFITKDSSRNTVLHATQGDVFIHIDGVYSALGDMELGSIVRRHVLSNTADFIDDHYLIRYTSSEHDPIYVPLRLCFKRLEIASLLYQVLTPEQWREVQANAARLIEKYKF